LNYKLKSIGEKENIIIVGCGGTGAFVADGICRLLIGRQNQLILIDHDRVEDHNLKRQAFYTEDLGRFKSETLAKRLAANYNREIKYSVYPYSNNSISGLTIGCVDNAAARKSISDAQKYLQGWWIDAGNGQHSGQVIIGNSYSAAQLGESFDPAKNIVQKLPVPTIQQPSLLIPVPKTEQQQDCAEAVRDDEQSPVINQAMASLVLHFVHKLINGQLSWMGAYLDLEAGTLHTVSADPETVARMMHLKVSNLVKQPEKQRVKVRV
jgi:PRTRC genetic system ThiF family protein